MSKFLKLLLTVCLSWLITSALAQIVSVGSGSYTTQFPGTDMAGRNGFPPGTPQLTGAALDKPVPTNDWWSKLLQEDHANNLYNYPFSMQTQAQGLVINYIPWGVQGDAQSVIVGTTSLNESNTTVSNYSDWTVTMAWGAEFSVTSGIGMPFLYFEKEASELASVQINQGTASVNGEMIVVTNSGNGANYVIYGPTGTTWNGSGGSYTSTLNGQNYWSLVMLPQGETDVAGLAEEYQKYAYVFPTNTEVSWAYDQVNSSMRSDFTVSVDVKEGINDRVLMGLLPHQWRHLAADSPSPQEATYTSIRGALKMLAGNSFSTEYSYHGILPTLPYLANFSEGFDLSALFEKVTLLENDQLDPWTDSYNEGQVMNRLIQTARIAHELEMTVARDKMIATIRERLEDWLTAELGEVAFIYYYNTDWTALIGYPAGHGQDVNINDHHFHWGYFIHAAAFMEQFDPGWATEWGPMIDLLVRDAASPSRDDELFPFLRNFSPYAGHCWANGFASFPQGNDQESTSESMQFNSSLIHWGSITGNQEIRDLGIYLYTTEQAAVEEYWFDIHEEIFPENQYALVSRVWGNSYDNGTFWTTDIEASYGIELYPIHGGSMYLGHPLQYAERLWAEIEANTGILSNDDNVNLWHDTMYKYLCFTDPEKAIQLYNSNPNRSLKFGVSDAQTYYWIHAMNAMGQVDATVTANYPVAVAFKQGEQYTYAAHNYANEPLDVTFSTGYVLTVPARSMATNRDTDITGELSSSFTSAFPGGSVELLVEVDGGVPSKVEFYDDGVLIGEVLNAPFSLVADDLAPRIHGFYAKVFDDEVFGLTNVLEVTVGEQKPYNDSRHQIPGSIQAGFYDYYEGGSGQGVAYADTSPGNNGDFRPEESVDALEVIGEGATVGWIAGGEWLEYSVEIAESGIYDLSFRYASGNSAGGGPFMLEINGEQVSESISVPTTGNWDVWSTYTSPGVELREGAHTLRVAFEFGEFNLGTMTFTKTGELPYGPPVADAGPNISVILPSTTTSLDGTGSSDPNGDALSYEWTQVFGPSVVGFSNAQVVDPVVSNLTEGVYKFELIVTDGQYTSVDDLLVIVSETGNLDPNVVLTTPLNGSSFREGEDVLLEASGSDVDGSISKVGFYEGETLLGEDLEAPFSYLWSDVPVGEYEITAVATDDADGVGTSEPISISVAEVLSCSETANESIEGTFSVGYTATFETVGDNVTVTFELLDTDKTGLVAFLWNQDPFSEVQMDFLEGTTFTKTLAGFNPGDEISVACKFAFVGGLAVTKYLQYIVGTDCDGGGDDNEAPTDFSANIGEIGSRTVELLLSANDASGTILYEVNYGSETLSTTGSSGSVKSLLISNLSPNTSYQFTIEARDLAGNVSSAGPLVLNATTIENASDACSGNDIEAQQGNFSLGYNYWFETQGTDVVITFELVDDREGVVAYLWRESPFAEFAMTLVEGKTYSGTIGDQSPGETISYACKFAFAGGLAVTKYFEYEVGDNCEAEDTTPPANFTASTGSITANSIEFDLSATDDSGTIIYEVSYNGITESISAQSGVQESITIDGLTADTEYSFTLVATDPTGNEAQNSPLMIQATTLESTDDEAPVNFTATLGSITHSSIEFLLTAEDNSGTVMFEVQYEGNSETISATSGVETSMIVADLEEETAYSFSILAKDLSDNRAANSPLSIQATTSSEPDTEAPFNFTIMAGEITGDAVELLLFAEDNSGEVFFEISHEGETEMTTGTSGTEASVLIEDLTPNTTYSFAISVYDASENGAPNNPQTLMVSTDDAAVVLEVDELADGLIYPNPVHNVVTIQWKEYQAGTLYNLSGQALLVSDQREIAMRDIPAGTYILILRGNDGQEVNLKLIKE